MEIQILIFFIFLICVNIMSEKGVPTKIDNSEEKIKNQLI